MTKPIFERSSRAKAIKYMKRKLKLFVWTVFDPDYTDGLAFAIAKDESEARKLVIKAKGYSPCDWGTLEISPLDKKTAFCVSGGGIIDL